MTVLTALPISKMNLESIDPIFADLHQCLTALSDRKYPEVIQSSTRGFDKLMRTHVLTFLYSRSIAYEKQGLLTRALEDANRMIQYVPDIASGYLRAGSVHMVNGKPHSALEVYNQGIAAAAMGCLDNPEYHQEYEQLHIEKEKAQERATHYVDIIANLPQELLAKILDDLDPGRVWVCLKVSKNWCDKVSRCGSVWWNSVMITQTHDTAMDRAICDALPLVKSYVHDLEFLNTWPKSLNSRYLDYLKNGVFENIKSLSLTGASIFENMTSEELCIALWQMRRTLTALTIDYEESDCTVSSLLAILAVCPGIEFLYYSCNDRLTFEDHKKRLASRVACKRLVTLQLYYGSTTIHDLYKHLALCPNIKYLALRSHSNVSFGHDSATSMTDICPKLKVLSLNAFIEDNVPFIRPDHPLREEPSKNRNKQEDGSSTITTAAMTTAVNQQEGEEQQEEEGIQYLQIRFDEHFRFDDAAPLIETQAHSLREMYISFAQPDDPNRITFPLRLIKIYDKLTKFQFVCEDNIPYVHIFRPLGGANGGANGRGPGATSIKSSVDHFVANLMTHSAQLKHITLKNMKTPTNSTLFGGRQLQGAGTGSGVSMLSSPNVLSALNTTARRRHLETLTLSSVYFGNSIPNNNQQQGGGIGAFFTEACHCLRALTIQHCNLLTDNTLLTLARSTSTIERLEIIGCQEVTKDGMKNFLKELAAAGQRHQEQHLLQQPYPLKEIELSTLSNALTDDVLQYVMDIKSLQTVRIIKCSSITVNGIKDLIRNVSTSSSSSTCIKNIEIRQCDSVLLLAVGNPNWEQEFENANSDKTKLTTSITL